MTYLGTCRPFDCLYVVNTGPIACGKPLNGKLMKSMLCTHAITCACEREVCLGQFHCTAIGQSDFKQNLLKWATEHSLITMLPVECLGIKKLR